MKNKIVFFPVKTVFRFHLNSKVDAWWTVGKYIFSRKREYRMLTSYSYVRFPLSKLTGEKIQSPNFTQNHLWKTNWKIKRSYFFTILPRFIVFFLSFNIKNYLHIQNKINLVFAKITAVFKTTSIRRFDGFKGFNEKYCGIQTLNFIHKPHFINYFHFLFNPAAVIRMLDTFTLIIFN